MLWTRTVRLLRQLLARQGTPSLLNSSRKQAKRGRTRTLETTGAWPYGASKVREHGVIGKQLNQVQDHKPAAARWEPLLAAKRLAAATDSQTFDNASRADLRGLDHLLGSFLRSSSVRSALAELNIGADEQVPAYHIISAFEFEGALTHALIVRGACGGSVPEEAARSLSRDFVDACFDGGHLGVRVFAISGAWTSWFYDVAWDHSFVAFDPKVRSWTCLFATDTD